MIYIYTHKDFMPLCSGEIISSKVLTNNYNMPVHVINEPLQHALCECSGIKYLLSIKDELPDVIAFTHNTRFFDDIELNEYDIILPHPQVSPMNEEYAKWHNKYDLLEVENIISEMYPQYKMDYSSITNVSYCNMFVMKKNDFINYASFLIGVIDIFCKRHNFTNDDAVKQYIEKYKNNYYPFSSVEYQSRLLGFLAERISNIFYVTYFKNKKIKYSNIIVSK